MSKNKQQKPLRVKPIFCPRCKNKGWLILECGVFDKNRKEARLGCRCANCHWKGLIILLSSLNKNDKDINYIN